MSDDFYSLQTDDIKIVQGDTVNILYEFFDELDDEADITGYDCKFTVRDPEDDSVVQMLSVLTTHSKEHNDGVTGGAGIFYNSDTQVVPADFGITANNQLAIVLDPADTEDLDYGVAYPFDIEFSRLGGNIKTTPIKGFLLISKEITE